MTAHNKDLRVPRRDANMTPETPQTTTEQIQLGPGLLVKLAREFGFPTLVTVGIAAAWLWQNQAAREDRKEVVAQVGKRLDRLNKAVRAVQFQCANRSGPPLPLPPDLEEEGPIDGN